jgi:hypothetical protein
MRAPETMRVLMSNFFWLTDAQMALLRPFLGESYCVPRVDGWRVDSDIIFDNLNRLRWLRRVERVCLY